MTETRAVLTARSAGLDDDGPNALRVPQLFSDLPDAVVVANSAREITWVNPAFERLFGHQCKDVLGRTTEFLYASHNSYVEKGSQHFSSAPSAQQHSYEVSYLKKNGEAFLSQTTGGPIRGDDDQPIGYFAVIKDISDTRMFETLLRVLFDIATSQSLSPKEKIHEILKLGCERFETMSAIVSCVRDQTYTVTYCYSEEAPVEPGTTFDLGDTYCSKTLLSDGPVAYHCASQSELATHPCYNMFLLETYIGVPLIVGGRIFGTLNFTSPEARRPFSEMDLEVIKLFAAWVSQQLSIDEALSEAGLA
ncbi:PAS domain S-box protein [Epibacterium sp. MM17-32]|uniref:PAS domain S-box protein n=1 Tax=Epibacterium sp. MM17-32 TaxID=2917734 RepID=UPI001EF6E57A|nr:PAS domain S-box protein [Epibacterium sp. MM17-32]MCG7630404.1 PAS domain S-box protein [Epibacterium sp. MM17-32]